MIMKSHYQPGFTLIELMIVVSLIGALMVVGSSLTTGWVASAQINNASAAMKNAVYQARIAALRNAGNKNTDQPAASVCIEDGVIKVVAISNIMTTVVCETAYNKATQKLSIAKGASITQGGTALSCMTFGPTGLALPFAGCSTDLTNKIKIEKSGESVEIDVI